MTTPLACDFHTHSNYSDGVLTPSQLVRAAREAGLGVISLTDHDITDGVEEAQAEGRRAGVEVIPGVELSAGVRNAYGVETEMHVLGYFINPRNSHLQQTLAMFRKTRLKRAEHMVAKLAHLGMRLKAEKIDEQSQGKTVGRPHIARALVAAGFIGNYQEAFDKYLKEGKPAYVSKALMSPLECIQLIHRAGGLAVVAHPFYGGPRQRQTWDFLIKNGLDGIEAHHSHHPPHTAKHYETLARDYGILVTGGSDFHSAENGPTGNLGDVRMPHRAFAEMRARKEILDAQNLCILQHAS